MKHRAGIAQTVDALIGGKQVGINARHLRRNIRADTELAAAELIDDQNGFQRQTGIDMRQ